MEHKSIFGLIHGYLMASPKDRTRRVAIPFCDVFLKLIDPASEEWDNQLIKAVFWEEDMVRILGIPIKQGMEGLLAWHFDQKDLFCSK